MRSAKRAITYSVPVPDSLEELITGHAIIRAMEWYLPVAVASAHAYFSGAEGEGVKSTVAGAIDGLSKGELALLMTDLVVLQESLTLLLRRVGATAVDRGAAGLSESEFRAFALSQFQLLAKGAT